MGKFTGYLFGSDIDGTLTVDGKVTEENARAIEYFIENGGIFVISSGRFASYVKDIGCPGDYPVIAVNGTVIYDPKEEETLWTCPMSDENRTAAYEIYLNCPYITKNARVCYENEGELCQDAESFKRAIFSKEKEPLKVVFISEEEPDGAATRDYILERYSSQMECDRSWSVGTEIHPKGTGKSGCMKVLRKMYPHVHTTVCVGDYENDLAMIRDADIGYAVENAIPAVKAVADRMAPHHTKHAIAYIVSELEKEIDAK